MCGKNALWVAKQHGHSIATMLRAYAAWAEGAAEVHVEAIKRSMIEGVSLVATNLAVDLPVANLIHALCMSTPAPECIFRPSTNLLVRKEKIRATQLEQGWLGWKDYSALWASPLRGRPRRVNTSNGANQSATTA
jgi:hypothetical protein